MLWRRNLVILWIGNFFIMAGMTLIIPFLPIYVQELGVTDISTVAEWSGVIFAGSPLLSGLLAPFWGKLSDLYGRKVMLIRSGIGMSIAMALMGLAQSPLQLLLLRLLMGTISGFIPTSVALQATETPKEHAGRALGILQTGGVTGSLIGPLIGGVLAEWIGIRQVFYLTGALLFLAALVVIFGVHESNTYEKFSWNAMLTRLRSKGGVESKRIKELNIYPLFITSFLIFFAIQSIEPVITVYVQSMNVTNHLETISGLVFAASGLGTIIAAPYLGRLGDRIGSRKVLLFSLIMMIIFYVPQAFATNPWVVIVLRLLAGLFVGGLVPSVNTLLRKFTPNELQGSVFGYNQRANSLGMVVGPIYGGFIASHFGIPMIFYSTGVLFVLNYFWVKRRIKETVKMAA